MDLVVLLTTFIAIFPVELPDKTMMATLVLATRYRPLLVWIGVCGAFFVQSVIAVTAGELLTLLPRRPLLAVAALLFATGAVILWRGATRIAQEGVEGRGDYAERISVRAPATGLRAVATSFLVLFAAEWGDLSQITTAGLVARYDDAVSVFLGAWLALASVAGLAVLAGRSLLRWIPFHLVRRIAATIFTILAMITALEAAGVDLPIL